MFTSHKGHSLWLGEMFWQYNAMPPSLDASQQCLENVETIGITDFFCRFWIPDSIGHYSTLITNRWDHIVAPSGGGVGACGVFG